MGSKILTSELKGYPLSSDYDLLYHFLKNDYCILGWTALKKDPTPLHTQISFRNKYFVTSIACKDSVLKPRIFYTKDELIKMCNKYQFKFILPPVQKI